MLMLELNPILREVMSSLDNGTYAQDLASGIECRGIKPVLEDD